MIIDISDAAEAAGRITVAEADELVLSDVIFVGLDEANQQGAGAVGSITDRAAA